MQYILKEDAYRLASQDISILLKEASNLRDQYKGNVITYSRKVFIPLTYLCRDTCSYCTYKKDIDKGIMLSEEEVLSIANLGKKYKCTEALIMTGERPEQRYKEVNLWLNAHGFKSTPEYIAHISKLILDNTGLLPHTNAGILNAKEMLMLRLTNPSLGLMLENLSERLMQKGMPHYNAPSKHPKIRLKVLEDASKLGIPFTTGILIGIGENIYEVIDSLLAIKYIHEKYNHIQEVIIQNFVPKPNTLMKDMPRVRLDYMLKVIAIARILMPRMNIQAPPNLMPNEYAKYIDAGINDYGGISPITLDHVNPEMPWPKLDELRDIINSKGYKLKARLPIYPEFINERTLSKELFNYIKSIIDENGYVKSEII